MTNTVVCVECGETKSVHSGDIKRLVAEQLCFTCNFWREKVAMRDNPNVARIEGKHYMIEDEHSNSRGFGGDRFVIFFADGRRVETHNLWFQGDIPAHFRNRLPDNATFER